MRRWRAVILGTALSLGQIGPLSADDAPRWLLFSGGDISSTSAFSYAGMRVMPFSSIDASGLLVEALSGVGQYSYKTSAVPGGTVDGRLWLAQAGAGYQWRWPNAGAALSGGLRYENHNLSPDDPGSRAAGAHANAYLAGDFWAKPLAGLLVSGQASATTMSGGYFARLTAAHTVLARQSLRLGVEAALLGGDDYHQWRLGALLDGIDLSFATLWLSAGVLNDQDEKKGAYGALGMWRKF